MSTEAFLATLQSCFDALPPSKNRTAAWYHFLELGLPDKHHDSYQYVPLRLLYENRPQPPQLPVMKREEIESYLYPDCKRSSLVFINGHFVPELSDTSELPKKIVVLPLQEAMKSYGPFVQNRWKKTLQEERDPFAVLNLALHSPGLFFYVPPHVKIETPIQALFLGTDSCLAPSRLQIFLAAHTKIQWISTTAGSSLHNTLLDIALEEAASFEEIETCFPEEGWQLRFLRCTLQKESHLSYLKAGSWHYSRHSLQALLQGERGNVLLQGVGHLKGDAQMHTHIRVEHKAPQTHSLQKFKGVLEDRANSSFSGKIYVHPEAQKTEAYQLCQNLLLSPGAIAQAKPNLEIFNPDVKASHGATVAQVDSEQLFYLQSRGLAQEIAQHLLVRGFIQEMVNQIPHTFMRKNDLAL